MDLIGIKGISTRTKLEVREKWSEIYEDKDWDEDYWRPCAMCEEIEEIIYDQNLDADPCDICPLTVDGWCRAYKGESRLARDYHPSDEAWLADVEKFLDWMDREINGNITNNLYRNILERMGWETTNDKTYGEDEVFSAHRELSDREYMCGVYHVLNELFPYKGNLLRELEKINCCDPDRTEKIDKILDELKRDVDSSGPLGEWP